MTFLEALILGLVQGLTEFIPISSSGHLILAQWVLGRPADHLFLEWINIGTVLALIIFFRGRIVQIVLGAYRDKDWRLLRNVLITALPAGIIGFLFADVIETNPFFSNIWVVVATLSIVGLLMVLLPKLPKLSIVEEASKLPTGRALTIGFAQALALIPGTSRSGSTILAGRLMGLKPAQAAEFSFLVSIPIMLGVTFKLLISSEDRAYLLQNASAMFVGNVAALISGILAVGFLMRYLAKNDLALFGWYRIILAGIIATILVIG